MTISGDTYQIDGKEVVLMGGNFVVKAQPYYPPLDVVRSNAQMMFQGAQQMAYVPPPASNGDARPVVPCVRLGAMMEAAMKEKGNTVDESFKTTLEGVVKTFQEEGVYVFLDMHQDACATTNGGEGYPWWVTADFQTRAGCKLEQCCCCCCFSRWCCECWPDSCRSPYITTPTYPLQPFFCLCNCAARLCNLDIETYDQDPVPWEPYSVGSEGNPAWMNVGNASMRRNNADSRWSRLLTTAQVQNTAKRIYASKHNDADREIFFDPFVSLVKYLCSVWEKYDNVIAVELMNEPPVAGLPNIFYVLTLWAKILQFQADVMAELEKDAAVPKCPIAIANWTSTVENESFFIKLLTCLPCSGTPREAKKIFDSFAGQNRLILSFHFYSPPATGSFEEVIQLAKKNAIKLGGIPIYLSEYFENGAQLMADKLAVAVDQGANAVTYWQYVDRDYTKQDGWYIYPEEVRALGGVVSNGGIINTPGWDVYKLTVADGTFWGAYITGAGGGRMNVLELVPATSSDAAKGITKASAGDKGVGDFLANLPVPWPKGFTSLHHGLKCDPNSDDSPNKTAREAKNV